MLPGTLQSVLDTFAMFTDTADRTELLLGYADRFREVPPEIATRPFGREHLVPQCESEAYAWARRQPDGTLKNRRNFAKYESVRIPGHKDSRIAEGNGADGLAIDGAGRVYAATNKGIEVFSPQGQHLGTIPVIWGVEQFALRKPANLAFAGTGKKTLYIFGAGGTAFKVEMVAEGFKGRAK